MNALTLLFALLTLTTPLDEVNRWRAALLEAHRANDAAALVEAAVQLRKEYPGHPDYGFLQMRGHVMAGKTELALTELQQLVRRDVDVLDAIEKDDVFTALRSMPAFEPLRERMLALRQPIGSAEPMWRFGDIDTVPESVALDAAGTVYLGSVYRGEVLVRHRDGRVEHWPAPDGWSVLGVHLSPDGKQLWAATAAMNVSSKAKAEDRGRSALVAYDVANGKLLARHELAAPGEHVLGDFIFLDADTLLTSDSMGGGVYTFDITKGEFQPRIASGILRSPQGLVRMADAVYLADYSLGLLRLNLVNGKLEKVADGSAAPYGIDGLYAHKGDLIAIQNGVRPMRVARFTLSEDGRRIVEQETLLANHADFQEPTLGMVDGDRLLLVANSQWNRFDRDGTLQQDSLVAPVILALALSRMPGS